MVKKINKKQWSWYWIINVIILCILILLTFIFTVLLASCNWIATNQLERD